MPSTEPERSQSTGDERPPDVHCEACQSALRSGSEQTVSFLLLDQLTIPVLACDDHLREFTSVCGLTTEGSADLLEHRPAGGICCPGCRNARYDPSHPLIPVQEGAVVVTACPTHQSAIVERFRTGLRTHEQLTASLGTPPSALR
ncbi:hypothetical protein [Halosimplex amylolyticum]|uniref:hypothetical protein n=1 Tax=Halosimplex amylolyticum TaxID=3396616 RepID=UPI003F558497